MYPISLQFFAPPATTKSYKLVIFAIDFPNRKARRDVRVIEKAFSIARARAESVFAQPR